MEIIERESGNQSVADVVGKLDIKDVQDVEYARFNIGLPILDSDIAKTFGEEFELIQDPRHVFGIDSVETSFVSNGILQQDTLLVGLRLHAFADAESFVVRGKTTSGKLAIFEHGMSAWRALTNMMHAYNFRFSVSQRYLLVNDPLSQMMFLKQPESFKCNPVEERDVVVKKHVEILNRRLEAQGAKEFFVPDDVVTRISTIDKQFVGTGATEPFYKLPKKALLPAGVPIGLLFQMRDAQAFREMQANLSLTESKGGVSEVPDDGVTVFRAGRIRLELGLMGCPVPREMLQELLEMDDVLDVCGRNTMSGLNEFHARQRKEMGL